MTSAYSFSVNYSFGSLTAISDAAGNLVESLSYDPWGRRRNPNDWNDYNVSSTLFDRGFTGHEHMPQFGLINMNGRVYDPFLASFLSPDPFVQASGNPQNYNCYTYALNNPLKYTDPSGYTFKPDDWDKGFGGAISYTPMHAGYQGNIGPGSGNHWSDPFRSEWGNFMLGNESSFNRIYGQGAYGSALKVWGDEDARQLWFLGQQSLRKGIWVKEIRINPYNVSISGNVVSYDGGPEVINKFVRFNGTSGRIDGASGGRDFVNSSLALDIGGGIYGALRTFVTPGDQWLGKNGKYYNKSWGGNRYTGSRSGAIAASNTYKWAGRATVLVTAAIGVYQVFDGYQMDGGQFGYNAYVAGASATGSILGGWVGAQAGASVGAAIGVWFGGVGAVPGAIIGGFFGGIAGSLTGNKAGEIGVNYYYGR